MYEDYLKRKEKLIISAIEILDAEGLAGLTIKSLAKREGITEPAIYRQFESKLDIILAILERFAAFDKIIRNTVTEQNIKPRDAVIYYFQSYAGYYQNYPQITTVVFSLDLYRYDPKTNSRMMEILGERREFIQSLIEKGQGSGEITPDVPAEDLRDIIWGQFWSLVFWWKINGRPFDLKDRLIEEINCFLP